MYKANIQDKNIAGGMLRVTVMFDDDGRDLFTEVFETNQPQSESWIQEQVQKKLEHLNGLPDLLEAIEVGKDIDHTTVMARSEVPTGREEYAAQLAKFEKYVSAIDRGFTTKENEGFKELRFWLATNFKPEYLDLL